MGLGGLSSDDHDSEFLMYVTFLRSGPMVPWQFVVYGSAVTKLLGISPRLKLRALILKLWLDCSSSLGAHYKAAQRLLFSAHGYHSRKISFTPQQFLINHFSLATLIHFSSFSEENCCLMQWHHFFTPIKNVLTNHIVDIREVEPGPPFLQLYSKKACHHGRFGLITTGAATAGLYIAELSLVQRKLPGQPPASSLGSEAVTSITCVLQVGRRP